MLESKQIHAGIDLLLKISLSVARDLSTLTTKDKEALSNVPYNVTANISSQAILRHNNIFNRYLSALLYLPSTTSFYVSVSKGAARTFFYTFGMV